MKPEDIRIGERGRSNLGDVAELAASIKAVGLLHPVVVTPAGELVAGERRLAACRSLGWTDVPTTVVDLDNAADALRAELEENTCRLPLSPYEADVIRQRREDVLRPKAKEQQGARTDLAPSPNLGGSGDRRTAKVAAIGTGYSGSTLDKVRKIRDVAERGTVRRNGTETSVPEPAREAARKALQGVKVTGAAVDRASKEVDAALAAYVGEDPDVKAAKLRKVVWQAIRAADTLPALDAGNVAAICDDDMAAALSHASDRLAAWVGDVEKNRPAGLRLVKGE